MKIFKEKSCGSTNFLFPMGMKHLGSSALMYIMPVDLSTDFSSFKEQKKLSIPFLGTKTVECFPSKQNENPNAFS